MHHALMLCAVRWVEKAGFSTLEQLARHYPKEYNQYRPWGAIPVQPNTRFVADGLMREVCAQGTLK